MITLYAKPNCNNDLVSELEKQGQNLQQYFHKWR